MNFRLKYIPILSALLFASCSDKNNEPNADDKPQAGKYRLSGKVEKGPFIRGSAISVQPLNESLNAIGTVYSGEIKDDAGTFDLGEIELASQYVRITSDGYYYNEVNGNLSSGQLHLIAIADLTDRSSINVNILTHLKAARIQNLMQDGKTFGQADLQAQTELLTQFGLQAYTDIPAEGMSISAGTDGSGVLIAISSLVLVGRSDAEITQYLSSLSQDLADDGLFTDDNRRTLSHDRYGLQNNLDIIATNISSRYSELGQTISVPDLRYFYDWNNDGIAGNEIADNVVVSLSQEEVSFDKNGGTATVKVTSNIPLSTEAPSAPDGDEPPSTMNPDSQYFDDFFVSTGSPMKCEYTYANNALTIKVDKSQRHYTQTSDVCLYDMMGTVRAKVKVNLGGDPSVPIALGDTGKKIVNMSFDIFTKSLSWIYYVERGYTGMSPYYDVECPLQPYSQYNSRAFRAAYSSIANNANFIKMLTSASLSEATPFFTLLNAITYTEMVDKWGRIGISELTGDEYETPRQESAETTLRYLENSLDKISSAFNEKNGLRNYDVDEAFDMPKDVWRMAKANVYMGLNEPAHALPYLQEIFESGRYTLSSGNEYEANSGSILFFTIPDEVMQDHTISYYSYADVLLLLAECNLATGNEGKAASLIRQIAEAKGITLTGDALSDIDTLRREVFLPRYFAFQKRHDLGGYASYQTLWPIPSDQISLAPGWTQNPGY